MRKNVLPIIALCLPLSFLVVPVHAQLLPISNYSLENGQSGFATYHDDTYTGSGNPAADGSFLSGGLGQLTDGVLGTDNIFDNGVFDWIGWTSIQPTITFDLGGVHSLSTLSFRSANFSSSFQDVGVFGSADVSFSNDGNTFTVPSTYFSSAADRTGDESRWVDIPLGDVEARFVRVQLFDGVKVGGTDPGAKPWIFISEAQISATAPEPGALALCVPGLLMIGGIVRRRVRT